MKRMTILMLATAFAVAGFTFQKAVAQTKPQEQQKKRKNSVTAREARRHGVIVSINKDQSALEVRKKRSSWEESICFDSSTEWTMGTKDIERNQSKTL